MWLLFFFFNDTATTEIYTLSLHDALPIWLGNRRKRGFAARGGPSVKWPPRAADRKSTRLNSSHSQISYAVFCLKKKQTTYSVRRSSSSRGHAYPPACHIVALHKHHSIATY